MFAAEDRGEVSKGTARRWAHETPNIKDLPEKKKKHKKHAAFMGGFLDEVVKLAKERDPSSGLVGVALRASKRLGRKHGDPKDIRKVQEIMDNIRGPKEPS